MLKKRKYPVIIWLIVCIAVILWATVGAYFFVGTTEFNFKSAMKIGSDALFGGAVEGSYTAEETATAEDIDKICEILSKRINLFAVNSPVFRYASVTKETGEDGKQLVKVTLPKSDDNTDDIARFSGLEKRYKLELVIADFTKNDDGGYVIGDIKQTVFSNDGIINCGMNYGSSSTSTTYYLTATLTEDATTALENATETYYNEAKAAAEAEAGEEQTVSVPEQRYFILVDGETVNSEAFTGKTTKNTLTIMTETNSYANVSYLGSMLNFGAMPTDVTAGAIVFTDGALAGFFTVCAYIYAAVVVLMFVWFIVRYRVSGIVAGIVWLASTAAVFAALGICGVIYSMITVIAIAAVTVASFAFTAIVMESLRTNCKAKTPEGAVSLAWKNSKKLIRIVGWISAAVGFILLFFPYKIFAVGVIILTFGISLLFMLLYVTKWCLISTQGFNLFRKSSVFAVEKK